MVPDMSRPESVNEPLGKWSPTSLLARASTHRLGTTLCVSNNEVALPDVGTSSHRSVTTHPTSWGPIRLVNQAARDGDFRTRADEMRVFGHKLRYTANSRTIRESNRINDGKAGLRTVGWVQARMLPPNAVTRPGTAVGCAAGSCAVSHCEVGRCAVGHCSAGAPHESAHFFRSTYISLRNALSSIQRRARCMSNVSSTAKKIVANIEKVIIGKRQEVILALVAYFSEGHILLEDVPGVAKTMLARALAQSIGGRFKRVQCTPDLLPNDITGASIFNPKTTEFEFRAGPIFAQILLADEINRTTPRTQAALLEAMAERRVSVDGQTYELDRPFLVIATQNPVDHEGTFPLPEAQLDRFLVRLSLGYPGRAEESTMLERLQMGHPIDTLEPVVSPEEVVACQQEIRSVHVDPKVRDYILSLVHSTRDHHDIALGGSPRASIALFRAAQSVAAIRGHNFVLPDDVKRIAPAVLTHRVIIKPESRLRKITAIHVVEEILTEVPVPTITSGAAVS